MTNRTHEEAAMTSGMQLVVFPAKDLDAAKKIFGTLLGTDPYADGPYYVGFHAGGLEVGLDPNGTGGPISYWDVDDITASVQSLVAAGATLDEAPHDVGRGLLIAKFKDVDGNVVGLRQSP
jgi:predicted enzyme related to lactoylglutathione lyase